jgi:hypothetical protein
MENQEFLQRAVDSLRRELEDMEDALARESRTGMIRALSGIESATKKIKSSLVSEKGIAGGRKVSVRSTAKKAGSMLIASITNRAKELRKNTGVSWQQALKKAGLELRKSKSKVSAKSLKAKPIRRKTAKATARRVRK